MKAHAAPVGSGKIIERNGYKMVWVRGREPYPSQTRAIGRYVYVHRLLMEEHLGRELGRREIVHHRNGDKHDNSLGNLEIVTPGQHRTIHGGVKGPRPHLWKKRCAWCGEPMRATAKSVKCCSHSCGQKLRHSHR